MLETLAGLILFAVLMAGFIAIGLHDDKTRKYGAGQGR